MKSKDKNEMQLLKNIQGFPGDSVRKELICNAGDHLQCRKPAFHPWVGKIPWKRKRQPTPVFLPGKSLGQRSLESYSQQGHKSQTRPRD